MDLTVVWAFIIAFAVFAYVVMDGFDLGIGILFPFFPKRHDRDLMTNSIAPVWDGNETWLVLGGGGLFAVFPLAYSIIMPALYAPIIVMLLALVFRGVAFEFRWKTRRGQFLWDWAFAFGSTVAAFAQGIALGALVQGIKVEGRAYATLIAAGSDGEGAQRQIDRIATGWRLRRVAEPVIVNLAAQTPEAILAPKDVPAADLETCRLLGAALAEGLASGIF